MKEEENEENKKKMKKKKKSIKCRGVREGSGRNGGKALKFNSYAMDMDMIKQTRPPS